MFVALYELFYIHMKLPKLSAFNTSQWVHFFPCPLVFGLLWYLLAPSSFGWLTQKGIEFLKVLLE